jgi:hypothetical protein
LYSKHSKTGRASMSIVRPFIPVSSALIHASTSPRVRFSGAGRFGSAARWVAIDRTSVMVCSAEVMKSVAMMGRGGAS